MRHNNLPVQRNADQRVPFELGHHRGVGAGYQKDSHELLVRGIPLREPLVRLDVEDLSVRYGRHDVISNLSFVLEAGSFTVITGRIGSGKSTLLRAMLGLLADATVTGLVLWNGAEICDRGSFLVPPQCAFVSQIPQLLSDSLADNILLGSHVVPNPGSWVHPARGSATPGHLPPHLPEAVRAAARALVQRPELLVVDDLSSALDVATEFELWENVAAAGISVLAVSHRPKVLEQADLLIDLG